MPKSDSESVPVLALETSLAGILALLAVDREERLNTTGTAMTPRKTEVVLADAGLTPAEIGALLNKRAATVAKAVSRARAKGEPE